MPSCELKAAGSRTYNPKSSYRMIYFYDSICVYKLCMYMGLLTVLALRRHGGARRGATGPQPGVALAQAHVLRGAEGAPEPLRALQPLAADQGAFEAN